MSRIETTKVNAFDLTGVAGAITVPKLNAYMLLEPDGSSGNGTSFQSCGSINRVRKPSR
jgi:hypothetical protein